MKISITILILLFSVLSLFGQNNAPVAVNDTIYGNVSNTVYITRSFLLQNDYDPDGDSIYIFLVSGFQKINDTTWKKDLSNTNIISPYDSIVNGSYILRDSAGAFSNGQIIIRINDAAHFDVLDINNISAIISPFGSHFWNLETAHFEVPKGSGKHSIFTHNVWIGGINDGDTLCTAIERNTRTGPDFFIGPITSGMDSNYYVKWNRVWKADKTQIQYHINNWNLPGYSPIEVIKNWPAHGEPALGQTPDIAPFYDNNSNGIYEPLSGDYPLIRGDQAVFFVFNDSNEMPADTTIHPLGIEIHGMAYGYDRPDDSTLNNTLFMHYEIVNRSSSNYNNTSIGLFTDFDLGFAQDDYIACDVTNAMAYSYNGHVTDGNGEEYAYGAHPPAIGMKVIGGPYLENDGIDNLSGECGFSLNGLNFGDNVVDNERYGMTNFLYYSNLPYYVTDTSSDVGNRYYNYMRSIWNDGTPMIYGGNGHPTTGGLGPDCNFMFPGNSDTVCNYGTNGILPNGGLNQNGNYWTEATVGNIPDDRRGVASIGPFNFDAGEKIPLDYCFTWARDYQGDNNSSAELLRERIAALAPSWNTLIKAPLTYFGVPDKMQSASLKVYPNPVLDRATVIFEGASEQPYQLFSIKGELLSQGTLKSGSNLLDISTLKPGVYILKSGSRNARVVKM